MYTTPYKQSAPNNSIIVDNARSRAVWARSRCIWLISNEAQMHYDTTVGSILRPQ